MDTYTKKRIQKLIAKGYLIKLPGGTSRDGNHSSFASLLRKEYVDGGSYRYFITVIPYIPLAKGQVRPESKEKVFPEIPEQTLEREILEETGISLAKAIYTLIGTHSFDDDRPTHQGKKHTQNHFLCTYFDASNIRITFSETEKTIGIPFEVELDDELEAYIASSHKWMIRDVRDYINCQPNKNLNLKKLPFLTAKRREPVY